MKITADDVKLLSLGSQLLGSGGGGDAQEGLETAAEALKMGGDIELISMEELAAREKSGIIVTISGVGSPASEEAYYSPEVYKIIVDTIQEKAEDKIIGFIACEIGASSTFEPFIPAALMGVPIIDAPCDGRAHPLGLMGALGLEKKGTPVWQAAAGGRRENHKYVELVVNASVESASNLVRNAASEAGGAVAVARNPVDIPWLQDAGAAGAYEQALTLGKLWQDGPGAVPFRCVVLAEALKGKLVCRGKISNYQLITENALDRGSFDILGITDDSGRRLTMTFFNEFMTLEENGLRLNTFPDVMIVVDVKTGKPLTTAEIKDGLEVILVTTSHENVKLGKGLKYRAGFERVESIIHKELIPYISDILLD